MIRWFSGLIVGAVVVLLLLYVSERGVQSLVVFLAMLGGWEYFNLTQNGASKIIVVVGILLCGLTCGLLIFWAVTPDHFLSLFAGILLLTLLLHFRGGADFVERVKRMVFFYFGIMYLGLLFAYWGWVRGLDHWKFWVFLMLGSTFLSDTGAYLVGHRIGRHKLAPRLSPGKTVEGLLGGWLFAVASAFVVRVIFWPDFPVYLLLAAATLIAFIGALGDLSESLLKRGVNAKDSGNLIPGHGGLLDRVDALLFGGPVVYYFAKYFGN